MKHTILPNTKLSDIIDLNFGLLRVLPRIGVDLQYCDRSLAEACSLSGADLHSTLMICNAETFDGYSPSSDEIARGDIECVMRYLHDSHLYYNRDALVNLEKTVDALMAGFPQRQKDILTGFVREYKEELARHFDYEENCLYPYIRSLERGERDAGYNVDVYAEKHENVEAKLCDLKNIIMRYLPENCDNSLRAAALLLIYHLEEDLRRHTIVENVVLVPMTRRMENGEKE